MSVVTLEMSVTLYDSGNIDVFWNREQNGERQNVLAGSWNDYEGVFVKANVPADIHNHAVAMISSFVTISEMRF